MQHSEYKIRQATPSDADQLTALYPLLVPSSPVSVLPERLSQLQASPAAYLVVYDCNGLLLGTVFLTLCPDPMYGFQPFGVIENIVVLESARGTGVGMALMAYVEQVALQADCSKLLLTSTAERLSAHAFFERCGFAPSKVGFVKYRRALGVSPAEA